MNSFWLPIISGVISSAVIDLMAFVKAREKDKSATFDAWLMLGRMTLGALTGALTSLGGGLQV